METELAIGAALALGALTLFLLYRRFSSSSRVEGSARRVKPRNIHKIRTEPPVPTIEEPMDGEYKFVQGKLVGPEED